MSRIINYLRLRPSISSRLSVYRNLTKTSVPMKRMVKSHIDLDETETKIRDLLMGFCNHYNSTVTKNSSDPLVLRITGGWVRDKLLGDHSHDLDIAVNFMSGEEFVNELTEYLQQFHPQLSLSAIHTIKKNPAKSKHLETCTTKIYDLDIDFVNLRSEKYTTDSRIPVIECGTAEEDALRRDATLNALFYNLNEQKIEDFTQKGLDDLKNGILRTPLTPLQTFLDDPLRVLRLIRFASRYNFIIEDETLMAMKNSDIRTSLLHKISRERVGVEIDKILTSNDPRYGLRLLNFVNISDTVFNVGTIESSLEQFNRPEEVSQYYTKSKELFDEINVSTIIYPLVSDLISASTKSNLKLLASGWELLTDKMFWQAITLVPFKNLWLRVSNKRSGLMHVPEIILKEGLRFGKHEFEPVSMILKHLDQSKQVFENTVNDNSMKRSELGLYLRTFDHYSVANILINCFDDIISTLNLHLEITKPVPNDTFEDIIEGLKSSILPVLAKYEVVLEKIEQYDLAGVNMLKPIVDGKTISKELNKKPGPWMAEVTHQVLVWQLDNPSGTKEDCLEYLRSTLE